MSASTLFRLSGLALLISAFTGSLGPLLHPPNHSLASIPTWNWSVAHGLLALTWTLRSLALAGLYARLANRIGVIGLVAFLIMALYSVNTMFNYLGEVNTVPALAAYPLTRALFEVQGPPPVNISALGVLAFPLSIAGIIAHVVFGVLIVRAWPQARSAGMALIIGILASFIAFPIAGMMGGSIIPVIIGFTFLSVGYGWLGLSLLRSEAATAVQRVTVAQAA